MTADAHPHTGADTPAADAPADYERFPYTQGPDGRVAEHCLRELARTPLGEVVLPSGDVARLAVRYADASQVLGDPRFSRDLSFPGAPKLFPGVDFTSDPDMMINQDPPRHTRVRRLLAGTFTATQVEAWRPMLRALVSGLVDRLPGPSFDFVSELASPISVLAIAEVMGLRGLDTERLRVWSDNFLPSAGLTPQEQIASATEYFEYMTALVAAQRAEPGGMVAQMMAADSDGDRLDEDELIHNIIGVFMAGHEATGFVLARSVLRLLDTPGAYRQLVERPELIASAVEELLRVEAPSDTALLRIATEDVELPSGTVHRGEAVLASIGGANHDSAAFDQPFELRLDRGGPQNLSFGRGAHFCLGFRLAKVELEESLAVLTERLPSLTLAVPRQELPWSQGAFKFLASLPVVAG